MSNSKRIAFYGGSFDPPHLGHLAVAHSLLVEFDLDQFVFIPAFHAPHKKRKIPTSAYDRYAMLCLITDAEPKISVSKMEIEMPKRPYSVETLSRLKEKMPDDEILFVMGADSWMDITTWREWESVLSLTNHIIVTRPGFDIDFLHVTDEIRSRIIDLRNAPVKDEADDPIPHSAFRIPHSIFITDSVAIDMSATLIRQKIRDNDLTWQTDVPDAVAKYIKKYQIYS